MTTGPLDIFIVCAYLCFLVIVGYAFSRFSKSSSDYFRAGGRGTWYLVGASMFMSGISTYTFVGNAAGIFKSGWSPLAIYLANIAGFLVGTFFMAAWYRQMRVITFAEAIRERFGTTTEQFVSVLLIVNGLTWTGAVLYGLSVFSSFLFPTVPSWMLICGVGTVVIIYCTVGGNWAVMANDFVQGLIMVAIVILVTTLCFVHAGGIADFYAAIANSAEAASDLRFVTPLKEGASWISAPYGTSWLITAFLVQFLNMISIFAGVRYFSAKDGREAARASTLAAVLMTIGLLVFFVPPIFARLFLYDEVMAMHADPARAPEFAYAVTAMKLLPAGGFSLLIVAMFAAAISSLDTGMNRNAAVIVRNVIPFVMRVLGRKQLNDDQEVVAGKIFTVVLGLMIMATALLYANMEGVTLFDLILTLGSILMLPLMVPLVLVLWLRRVPPWSALASIGGGFVPSLIDYLANTGWSYQERSFWVVLTGAAVYLFSMLFYRKTPGEYKERAEEFYRRMTTKVDFAKEVGHANDGIQLIQIGRFGTVLGSFLLLLQFLKNPLSGHLSLLAVALFVGGIGAAMWILGKRISHRAGQYTD